MNLFIFRVETGTMLEFQLNMATESVAQLKQEIMKILKVPSEDQVLLVSGGICLENNAKVISYSAGTDTNPIFLFSKQSIESPYPPSASPSPKTYSLKMRSKHETRCDIDEYSDDSDGDAPPDGYSSYTEFRKRVYECRKLPASMETVTKRAKLAQEFYDEAVCESKCCQDLVHDQHLQHQGWAAAIANLEDTTVDLERRISVMQQFFDEYVEDRDSYVEFFKVYKNVLDKLSKIPIIPSLLLAEQPTNENADSTLEQSETSSNEEQYMKTATKTLLEWIEARRDSKIETTMDTLYETGVKGIGYYHAELFANLYSEIQMTVATANQKDMKEISGLSSRLYGLNTLVDSVQKHVKEQEYSAESFQKNQSRAGNLGDTSVLPDLCDSHRKQLVCMLKNHWKLCDIHKRCMRSKEELCGNLYQRLKWVIHVESLIQSSSVTITAYYDTVLRLRSNLNLLQQIYLAPETYMAAVVEVVRRKKFSQAFLLWASELACYMLTIYNDEMTRRKEFKAKYDDHFLMGLFPGMDDMPSNFATQAPSIFDSSLPNITIEDIEELKKAVPEMAESLVIQDLSAITNFFLAKSVVKSEEETCVEDKLVKVVNEVGLASNLDQNLLKPDSESLLPHGIAQLKDLDKGCESETDTEEFEKVCQSPVDLQFEKDLPSPRPGYSDVTTLTEVCDKQLLLPTKPSRTLCNTKSVSESFAKIKNGSLESLHLNGLHSGFVRSKSLSPHTPGDNEYNSPMQGHQPSDFISEEFYIDESLPSSLSIDVPCERQNEQRVGEIAKQLSNANDVVALLQDNLESSRSEQDKLKDLLLNMATLCRTIFINLRQEMEEIKSQVHSENSLLETHCKNLSSSWDKLTNEFDIREKEIRELTDSHQQEISAYRAQIKSNNNELKCLREENSCLDSSLNKLADENKLLIENLSATNESFKTQIASLESNIKDTQSEKERLLKETIDRMAREHKTEMDNLRKKFRFMTDRSPSECMEKSAFETGPDVKKKELNFEKAMEEFRQAENARVEKQLQERNKEVEFELIRIREEAKRALEEKDKLIQILRERESSLNRECSKHKNTLLQLTQSEMKSSITDLKLHIDVLQKEKHDLEHQLTSERLQRMESSEMSASTSSSTAAKRVKYKEPLTSSQASMANVNRVNVDSCSKGDTVLVIWKPTYKHFIVVQEGDVLHFVHSECIRELEMHTSCSNEEKRIYFTAVVLEKEYCQTKKSENRYNVPKGTKFYRVKIRPISVPDESRAIQSQMSQSETVPKTPAMPMSDSVSDSACHSLPSSPTKEAK